MPVTGLEKLTTTLVALFNDETRDEIDADQLRTLINDPSIELSALAPLGQVRVRSARYQLDLTVEPKRVVVRDLSSDFPARPDFLSVALPVVAYVAPSPARAHGWNIDVTFDAAAPQAGRAIASRFINGGVVGLISDEPLASAKVEVTYARGTIRYTLRVEPRQSSLETAVFFAHLVGHYESPIPETVVGAQTELEGTERELRRLLEGLFP
jgi:hypothetical protein